MSFYISKKGRTRIIQVRPQVKPNKIETVAPTIVQVIPPVQEATTDQPATLPVEKNKIVLDAQEIENLVSNLVSTITATTESKQITRTCTGMGRLGNQIIRNLATSIVAEKHNLQVEYSSENLINQLGIKLFSGEKIYEKTNIINERNFFDNIISKINQL